MTVVGRIYSRRRRRRDSGSIVLVEFTVAHLQLRPKLMLLARATVQLPPSPTHTHRHRLPWGNGGDCPRKKTTHRAPPCEELDPATMFSVVSS